MSAIRRHPPLIGEVTGHLPDARCLRCWELLLAPIHQPPRGWRENVLSFLGVL